MVVPQSYNGYCPARGPLLLNRAASFPRYGKHRKLRKSSTKRKTQKMMEIEYIIENTENCGKQRFCDSKAKNIQENHYNDGYSYVAVRT